MLDQAWYRRQHGRKGLERKHRPTIYIYIQKGLETMAGYLSRHRTFGINSSKSVSCIYFQELTPQELFSESRYRNLSYKCLFYECLFYECLSSGACLRMPVFGHGRFSIWKTEHGRFSILENRTWPIFDFGKSNMADVRISVIEHGQFSDFGNRTWPIFDFRLSNMAKSCNSRFGI